MIAPSMKQAMRQRLDETGIDLANIELLSISESVDPESNRPVLEPGAAMGLNDACPTLERALFFVKAVNMAHVGVALDFLHMVRTGATAVDIRNIPREFISYAQICDGPDTTVRRDYLCRGLQPDAARRRRLPVGAASGLSGASRDERP